MTSATIPQLSLDDFQRDAVDAPEGPGLIIGGPGTGKTHTLIARIIAMVQQGVPTGNITYLTFNSQGAQEVRRQLDDIGEIQHLFVGSFHQFASYFLRQAGAAALGMSPNYTIWDHHQMGEIVQELSQADPVGLGIDPERMSDLLHWHGLNQARFPDDELPAHEGSWHRLIGVYTREKRRQNVLDLNDLIPMAIRAMNRAPHLRANWNRTRTRHLLVDEFQDMTPAQYHLMNLLTGPTKSVIISTDPNQNIYTWRGADPKLLNQFRLNHRTITTSLLRMNHRMSLALSNMATHITNHPAMTGLNDAFQTSFRDLGDVPVLLNCHGEVQYMDRQALTMAKDFNARGVPWEDMAFIYRRHSIGARILTTAFNMQIHYTMLGETKNQGAGDARCITNLMTSVLNPLDSNAFSIAASIEDRDQNRRLNPHITTELLNLSRERGITLVAAAEYHLLNAKTNLTTAQNLRYVIDAWRQTSLMLDNSDTTLYEICQRVYGLIHEARGRKGSPSLDSRVARLLTISDTTPRLPNETPREHLARFLELLSTAPYPDHRSSNNDDPFAHHRGITLSTIHAAKGLQWKFVWIMNANDHIMPGILKEGPNYLSSLEEEQRIFYVAATRATDRLFLCSVSGEQQGIDAKPSRFIQSIGEMTEQQVF